MKNKRQKWQLELHRHRRLLRYGHLDTDGKVRWIYTRGHKYWEIGKMSWWPVAMFHPFFGPKGYIATRVKRADDKSFTARRPEIVDGLLAIADACGCEVKRDSCKADCTLFLYGKPFFAFQIYDFQKFPTGEDWKVLLERLRELDRFVEMERRSRAMLRGAIVLRKGGQPYFVPGRTRK